MQNLHHLYIQSYIVLNRYMTVLEVLQLFTFGELTFVEIHNL